MIRWTLKWLFRALIVIVIIVAAPIIYVETACRGTPIAQAEPAFIKTPEDQRAEARTYMTYPEWHIVYAYEGYAQRLKSGPPHRFGYFGAITGFWSSLCSLNERADTLGAAGWDSKTTIYTIGASFTLEMLAKAAYEETIGRGFSAIFGTSAQDDLEAEMAADYAEFLQQTPWYKFDFPAWRARLWALPATGLRGWERRLALGGEWSAKAGYARVISQAVAGIGADELTMKVALRGISPDEVAALPNVVSAKGSDVVMAEVDRYRRFTELAKRLAETEAEFIEIAGNDDILVSLISDQARPLLPGDLDALATTRRPGFDDYRLLVALTVPQLLDFIRELGDRPKLEHIYDY